MVSKVLLADDEAPFEMMTRKIFRSEIQDGDYQFRFARDGQQALEILEQDDIDILVTDINMPKMDGLTLLGKVRSRWPNVVPVVISAYGDLDNIRNTMNSGAFDFLVKPVDRSDFRKTLAKAARQSQQIKDLAQARNERQLAQQQMMTHLQKMDRLKDEFLANVSHELLTPLNGIVGIAESLCDGAAGGLAKEVHSNLDMIVTSGKRLTSLVHDILDFARIKNSELKLNLSAVDLRPLVKVVLTLSQPLLESKDVVLQADIADDLPPVVADENRVQQILHNLVGNAIKFTAKGYVRLEAVQEGNYVRLSVIDTGIGIPEDKLDHIFEAFERMDGSDAEIYAGTGLGLTITRKLITLLKGEVTVQSEEGKGSAFSITLPVTNAHRESGPPSGEHTVISWEMVQEDDKLMPLPEPLIEMPQPESREIYRLLAVDDEGVNLRVLKNQFSLHHYKVDTATNGEEALRAIEAHPDYDLVLMDVMMPGMSGYDVCRKLRETYSLFELPILILTAKNHPSSYLEGLDAGANDYLPKPFDKRELLARAKTLLILKKAVRRAIEHNRHLEAERLKRGMADNLRKITETLTSTLELDQVLARFLESLAPVAPFDRAIVNLLNEDSLEPANLFGFKEMSREELDNLHGLLALLFAKVSKTKEPWLTKNRSKEKQLSSVTRLGREASLLAVPLLSTPGHISGMLLLERAEKDQSFSDQECQLVTAFAGQAAIAIDNARLFEKVQTMAKTEELTGLHNRRHFFVLGKEAFDLAKQTETPLSAIMLDVDHFKQINDTYGHAVGDEVLQTVAQRIRIACRKTDIIGRYGGEEFAILLPETALAVAREVAERLRLEIQQEFQAGNQAIVVTASLGVAHNERTKTLADLIRIADDALYRAKDQGRNRTVTTQDN